jgi:hypothetical protein
MLLGHWRGPLAHLPLWKTLAVVIDPIRRAGERLEGIDDILRQWSAAGISLLVLALAFGASMLMAS